MIGAVQINLWCADVERCAGFFRALGLEETFRYPLDGDPHQIEVDAAGVRIGFSSASVGEELFGIETRTGPDSEIVLWCDDAGLLFDTAVAAGAQVLQEPADSPDGRLLYAWVTDPEGHRVKFVHERSPASGGA
ncbi:glyoxalase/bleomycin resistance/extradiol dioxygenase family protein [Microbacterium sp. G2-8]|uniref:VOC family protein n=1 Tax=Microbacterium sp. G2-8 TaxID=2842454 RepID=UPI001C89FF5E|nr:VOC family protein [Microbacterium sp. G2-8]